MEKLCPKGLDCKKNSTGQCIYKHPLSNKIKPIVKKE